MNSKYEKLVSVVIPVYNTGKLLKKCITSIRAQTYENIEIIIIDDCSNQDTVEVLESEVRNDGRIRVFHLGEKVGAGEARNIGMSNSKGDYIVFLDSDDFFEPDLISSLLNDICLSDADVCMCGFKYITAEADESISEYYMREKQGITDTCFCLAQLGEDGLDYFNAAPWNKIIKTDYIKKNNIRFQSLTSCNDLAFTYLCCLRADRIVYCKNKKPLVNYRINTNNQISSNRNSLNLYYAINKVIAALGDNITELELTQVLYAYILLSVYELQQCKCDSSNREFYVLTKELLERTKESVHISDNIINKRINRFLTMDFDSRWFVLAGDFYYQIRDNFIALSDKIKREDSVLIWGNGNRSKALQKVLREEQYVNVYITDLKNDMVGDKTVAGYKIISTEDAFLEQRIIIASNVAVFNNLVSKGIKCINLEEYCPYD